MPRWILTTLGVLGVLVIGFFAARTQLFHPPERMREAVVCEADAPVVPVGQPLKVLVWNIQFAGGRDQVFFYDGGTAVSVPEETVTHTLDQIAQIVQALDPDLVLLQEVDRNSRRTAGIDEHSALLDRLDYPCHTSTPYHRVPYLPHPSHEHLGRVDMHLSVFSKYRIDEAVRHQLPLLDESPIRRLFNLRRALLRVELPTDSGRALQVFNTHLSAFSKGDGTLPRQIEVLERHLGHAEATHHPWLLGGDLNSLPPGDDPLRLPPAHQALYAESESPVGPLLERFGSPVTKERWAEDPTSLYTYLPPHANEPDRTLDYVFHGSEITSTPLGIVQDPTRVSDHLPMVFEATITPMETP